MRSDRRRKTMGFVLARWLAWATPLVLILAAHGQAGLFDPDFKERDSLFSYDRSAGMDVKEAGVVRRGSATLKDIEFTPVPGGRSVKAYLVIPDGGGPFAGVLWVHWLGEKRSSREQFLEEALALAPRGAVSLLADAMWAEPDWYRKRDIERDLETSVRQVIELRRALDLLAGVQGVDPARLAVVGHDYGGMYGTILAGVDQRPKTYVLAAVTPSLLDWAFFFSQPKSKVDYIRRMAVLDLTEFLRRSRGGSFLFQFAAGDIYVSRAGSAVYFSAAPAPKERKFYDCDHEMVLPAVAADREAWLVKELGLK